MRLPSRTDEELAAHALRKTIADLADSLHLAISEGLDRERLHAIVSWWELNAEDLTFASLVESGADSPCHDCGQRTTPYDAEGRPEDSWEHFMVVDDVWEAAAPYTAEGGLIRFLCVGCLERRIGRRLGPGDFEDLPINEPSELDSDRLRDRLGAR